MSALDRKLTRDLLRMKGQVITIALVLACGILAMIMMRSTFSSLVSSRDIYYDQQRFGDVFARLERAPESVAKRLERIPGVARVYTRVVEEIMVPMPDEPEPIPGRIVSIPESGLPPLNGIKLVAGRLPAPGVADEAVILEAFAVAHGLQPGDRMPAVINGKLRQLQVVGIALSPEYVLAMSERQMVADKRRFVVMWMHRDQVAPAFRMEGAFDDVVLGLQPDASLPAVLDAVDRELAPYGGYHAVGRDRQTSNYALSAELGNLRSLAVVIPLIFLSVAAFLVNVVVSRLVYLERTQIAVLKALGYRDGRIALHYLALVALIVGIGGVLGTALGAWAGHWMTGIYTGFYKFPGQVFQVSPGLVISSIGIALAAATVGAMSALRRVARMPPAQAMRPPTPLTYRRSLLELFHLDRVLGPTAMMVAREITRRPVRFLFSSAGIAFGVAIFIFGRFSWDSFQYLFDEVYVREHREDLTVTFTDPRPDRAVRELAHLPGVTMAEGERIVPARFLANGRWRDGAVIGIAGDSHLRQLVHARRSVLPLPQQGAIITDQLGEILGVGPGDEIDVEIMEGDFATRRMPVVGLIDEPFGLQAYTRRAWLDGFLREEPRVTSVDLLVAPGRMHEIEQRLQEMPRVIASTSRARMVEQFDEQTGESLSVITLILTLSAATIAIGVVYNNARVALSLRSRDLASLRVLGFTRREISSVLLGELAAQVVVGIPIGLWLGHWWSSAYAASIDLETMRFPLYNSPATYAMAAVIALVSGLISALLVRRKLDQLDLISVLKAAE